MSHMTNHKSLFKFVDVIWQARLCGILKLGFWWVCFKTVLALCGFLVFCFFFLKASDSWPAKCFFSLHLVSAPFIISLTTATMFFKGQNWKGEFKKPRASHGELITCTRCINQGQTTSRVQQRNGKTFWNIKDSPKLNRTFSLHAFTFWSKWGQNISSWKWHYVSMLSSSFLGAWGFHWALKPCPL